MSALKAFWLLLSKDGLIALDFKLVYMYVENLVLSSATLHRVLLLLRHGSALSLINWSKLMIYFNVTLFSLDLATDVS